MSLRDEIAREISYAYACAAVTGHWLGQSRESADKIVALLREKGKPMWCSSRLCNEWAVDNDADMETTRFVLLDLGGETP